MRGIIWGSTVTVAWEELEKMKENYQKVGFAIDRESNAKSRTERDVWFSNGDHWTAIKAQENKKGAKANISYVDRKIDKRLINEIILPATTAYPYSAIRYFGDK